MDFAELEKDTASRDEWLLMCRKQNVFSQMILIKDDIHYGQINSDFLQTTFFPFATFFVFEKELGISFSHNMDDESTWKSTTNITSKKLYSQLSKTLWNLLQQKVKFSFLGNSSS
ncbi:uncharacterized protein LOC103939967 isoform X5 [Pyrus x bretschneideri]|uniref:uncharacterized protein LOC103939967 isoform X5 n=1 Tax=Pyrus x bretschneideri TaxID=225117 RepID=UPI00202F5737|nr:uncharacterized protein LOC103939967 isoform X5 [Pyrus x bretschneideri]